MAKASKKETKPKKKRGNYDEKLAVNGSFLDLMKAAVKDAENKSAKKEDLEKKVDEINKKKGL